MILAVVGDRYYGDYSTFSKVVRDELERTGCDEIVTGDATGADTMAYDFAALNNIPYMIYCASSTNYLRLTKDGASAILVADWKKVGAAAGPLRNYRLLKACNNVLLFDGGGPGSANVKLLGKRLGKPVEVWEVGSATQQQEMDTQAVVGD